MGWSSRALRARNCCRTCEPKGAPWSCRGCDLPTPPTASILFIAGIPEAWLESQVRSHIQEIDASLLSAPVYGQVPAFAAADRGVLDLLAVDNRGRLAVIELKASEDVHLPLQALDYWMRVQWHVERREFQANGYFPRGEIGRELLREPPRLLLVSPALDFHPSNERVLRYFSPRIPVERIGVGLEWRKELKVMYRSSAP